MFRLEDIGGNVADYGNHNKAYIGQLQQTQLPGITLANGLPNWTEIWNSDLRTEKILQTKHKIYHKISDDAHLSIPLTHMKENIFVSILTKVPKQC